MSEDWREVTLSDVLAPDNAKLGAHDTEPAVLSLSKYDGFVRSAEYFDRRIASAKLDGYKLVPPGTWAYSTIHIDEGSIARNNLGMTGVISPMYTTMRWVGAEHDPRYFEYLLRTPAMLRAYADHAQGSINRRRSLPYRSFAGLSVRVPPLVVQRRIVDLVGAIDTHIASLAEERGALMEILAARRSDIPPGEDVPIGSVLDGIDGGRSLGLDGSAEHPTMRVLKLSAVRPGQFRPSETKPLPADAEMPGTALVREGDLLITRSNTPDRVGFVCRAWGVLPNTYMPDLVWRLRPSSTCDPAFLEQVLCSQSMRARISASAGGTSQSMRKINKAGLRALLVRLPALDQQREYATDCAAIAAAANALADEAHEARHLRVKLLESLLSREVEIPETYDRLVDVGVV